MAQFFITRPVLAWVISIFIVIAGLISLPSIPVAQYPQVAWPQITISTSYTGAAPGEIYAVYEGETEGRQHIAFRCPTTTTSTLLGRFVPLSDDALQAVTDPAGRAMLTEGPFP